MALFIKQSGDATREYAWHIGEPMPEIGAARTVRFFADGDELALILDALRAKPVTKLKLDLGAPPEPGQLLVGTNGRGEVVVNHPDIDPDEDGAGHIIFSPSQARNLAVLLIQKAAAADCEPPT